MFELHEHRSSYAATVIVLRSFGIDKADSILSLYSISGLCCFVMFLFRFMSFTIARALVSLNVKSMVDLSSRRVVESRLGHDYVFLFALEVDRCVC